MHELLQTDSHLPQWIHPSLDMLILKNETFDINPKRVPTGHIELQYNLPFRRATSEMRNIVNASMIIIMKSAYLALMGCTEYILNFNNTDAIVLFIPSKTGVMIDDENLPNNENGSSHTINKVPAIGNGINAKHSIEYLKILFS